MGGANDAYTAWSGIRDYFQANQGAHYLHLTRQFRNLKQDDLTVSKYARRLKVLVDGLAGTDNSVTDHDLMMQLLHGLDARLDTIRTILGDTNPLPPFDVVRSWLDLADYNVNLRAAESGFVVLTISGGSAPDRGDRGDRLDRGDYAPSSGDRNGCGSGGNCGPSDRGGGGDHGHGRGRGGNRGRGRSDSSGRGTPPPSPWMGYFAPYGMALPAPCPAWTSPNDVGVLRPRPGIPSQAYTMMLLGSSLYAAPPPTSIPYGAPSWDQSTLLHQAYNQ
ncbi:uncharacterized protein LOC119305335 [Triticum dicoccoides]|uniref:uncharacterized protein LOC119305335 n=1 Tax=Triticum dicoccoides TaxID=85692 RepID=UPI00188F6CE5|nr:uncharacterized protein LOC119305335 [Triticum dicoccoides]